MKIISIIYCKINKYVLHNHNKWHIKGIYNNENVNLWDTLISSNPSNKQVLSSKEEFFPKGDERGRDLFEDPSLKPCVSSSHFLVDFDQDT